MGLQTGDEYWLSTMTLMDPLAGHSAVRALPVPPGLFIRSRPCAGSPLTLMCKFSSAHQSGSTLNQLFVDSNAIVEADKLINFIRVPDARALYYTSTRNV